MKRIARDVPLSLAIALALPAAGVAGQAHEAAMHGGAFATSSAFPRAPSDYLKGSR